MLAHRLVLKGVGGSTVDELSHTMTIDEFLYWMAFDSMEPIGREDYYNARRDWTSAKPHFKNVPKQESFRLGRWPKKKMTPEEIELSLKARFDNS